MIISEFFAGGMMVAVGLSGIVYIVTENIAWGRLVGIVCIGITVMCIDISIVDEYFKKIQDGAKNEETC
jgi:hypothetical protein